MANWIRARWREYLESYDPESSKAGSTPGSAIAAASALSTIFLALAYVPVLREASNFKNVWWAVALTFIGCALSCVAWRFDCRGPVGSVATLLDNTFYSQALAFAALNTQDSVSLSLALIHAVVLTMFAGQVYGFSLVLVVSLSAPIAGLLLFYNPPIPILLLMTCGTVTALLASIGTRNRLEFARRQKNLEDALGAADKVMEESVQAALTSTLLTLGHFLHELSNYQTAISTNLDYIKVKARLSPEVGRALQDAQTAQQEQETLLRRTISDLRSRARPEQGSFQLFSVLSSAAEDTKGLAVTVATPSFDFEVTGNPEHLRVVLLNLLRNAEQANARAAQIDVTLEAKGHVAQIVVHNDGDPIPDATQATLFKSFASSEKPGGSGLGLYLVRRYVEVLGGRIAVKTGPMGGAAFVMQLPGRTEADATSTRSRVIRNLLEKSA